MEYKILSKLLIKTDLLLWSSYDISINQNFATKKNNLIFPVYHNNSSNELRISEQEARFIFADVIQNSDLLFSIETPTLNDYQQKGKRKRSAETDMTLYSINREKLLNIEFKSGTISRKAKSTFPIAKDIEKIFSESIMGCWFHILKSVNNSTINELLLTLKRDIENFKTKKYSQIKNNILTIHLCILKHGFSITKQFDIMNFSNNFFEFEYQVSRTELLNYNSLDWFLYKKNGVTSPPRRQVGRAQSA